MKKTVGAILKRIGRDIRQYKWAGAAFLIYYIVVKAVFHAFCPLPYPGGAALSGLRHYKGAYLYFSGTVRKGVAAESMRFFDGSVWGIFCLYAVCEGERGKVCHENSGCGCGAYAPCLYISHGYGISRISTDDLQAG